MTCIVCSGPLPNSGVGSRGHKLKYCSEQCKLNKHRGQLITKQCEYCSNSFQVRDKNKLKRFCSELCSDRARKPRNEVLTKQCFCGKQFETSIIRQKFCSEECRYAWTMLNYVPAEPKTHFEYQCDWCSELIIRDKPLGGLKRYHPDCSKKAQTARMRIKTVKRQGITNPKLRMCHEDLLARDGNICYLCNEPIDYERYRRSYPNGAWIDHVESIFEKGAEADRLENLRLTHGKCNRAKWHKPLEEYLAESR